MQTTYDHIKQTISQNFPEEMVYQTAQDVRVGKGKKRRRIKRRVGISKDGRFSLEMFGSDDKIHRIKFLVVAVDKLMLARNLVPIRAVIESIFPDWKQGDELGRTADGLTDMEKQQLGPVEVGRMDISGHRFISVMVE